MIRKTYQCPHCGAEEGEPFNRCESCKSWIEDAALLIEREHDVQYAGTKTAEEAVVLGDDGQVEPAPDRLVSGMSEFDRVVGGGICPGTAVIFTGKPGIGKSTLFMQAAAALARNYGDALYASSEETLEQIKARGQRLSLSPFRIISSDQVGNVIDQIQKHRPPIVFIDSLQSLRMGGGGRRDHGISARTGIGSRNAVSEITEAFLTIARDQKIAFVVAFQITKQGVPAGSMGVLHAYDGNFELEDRSLPGFIFARVEKNRYGSRDEVGVFRMTPAGLLNVECPSAELLRDFEHGIIIVTFLGNRPIATALQIGFSSRCDAGDTVIGYPKDRMCMIRHVLNRLGIKASARMVLNVLGGYQVRDTAADLAVAIGGYYATNGEPIPPAWAAIGEVTLDGRLLAPDMLQDRIDELVKLEVPRVIIPTSGTASIRLKQERTQIMRAATVLEALILITGRHEISPAVEESTVNESKAAKVPGRPSRKGTAQAGPSPRIHKKVGHDAPMFGPIREVFARRGRVDIEILIAEGVKPFRAKMLWLRFTKAVAAAGLELTDALKMQKDVRADVMTAQSEAGEEGGRNVAPAGAQEERTVEPAAEVVERKSVEERPETQDAGTRWEELTPLEKAKRLKARYGKTVGRDVLRRELGLSLGQAHKLWLALREDEGQAA